MTVKELKEYLKLFPDDMKIMVDKYDVEGYENAELIPLEITTEKGSNETILYVC